MNLSIRFSWFFVDCVILHFILDFLKYLWGICISAFVSSYQAANAVRVRMQVLSHLCVVVLMAIKLPQILQILFWNVACVWHSESGLGFGLILQLIFKSLCSSSLNLFHTYTAWWWAQNCVSSHTRFHTHCTLFIYLFFYPEP